MSSHPHTNTIIRCGVLHGIGHAMNLNYFIFFLNAKIIAFGSCFRWA
jgi:hypothetical protein